MGANMMTKYQFVDTYGTMTTYKPQSEYVLLLSLNANTQANKYNILKSKNRTFVVCDINVLSIRHQDKLYADPGASFRISDFKFKSVTIDVFSGEVMIEAISDANKEFNETIDDIMIGVRATFDPLLDTLRRASNLTKRAYTTENGQNAMYDYVSEVLQLFNLLDQDNPITDRVITLLKGEDEANYVPDPTNYPKIYWTKKSDYLADLNKQPDKAKLFKERAEFLRNEYLLNLPIDERFAEMSLDEVKHHADFLMIQSDAEYVYLHWDTERAKELCEETLEEWKRRKYEEGEKKAQQTMSRENLLKELE
jgi:hypothetical protein